MRKVKYLHSQRKSRLQNNTPAYPFIMNNLVTRILGIIGIIGAPWIFIDFIQNGLYERFSLTPGSGVRNFIFITGWTCSVLGLYRLQAMGSKRWQKRIMIIQIILLCFANCWDIYEIFAPNSKSFFYTMLDFGWPIAGVFMLITGIVILRAKRFTDWRRYIPLVAGLWFPLTTILYFAGLLELYNLIFSGVYAAIAF